MKLYNYAVFYINLEGSNARRLQVEAQLESAGLSYTRVPAFDGRNLNLRNLPDYAEADAVRFMGRPLSGGEYGCYKSHLDCLSRFLLRDEDYCLVFEDDVSLDAAFSGLLEITLDEISSADLDWDVVHLSPDRIKIFTPFAPISNARHLVAAHYFPMTTSALLWSRKGAKNFLESYSKIIMPIDNQLREAMVRSGKGFAVWPPLAKQVGLHSDIDHAKKRKTIGRRWFYGIAKQRRLLVNKFIAALQSRKFRALKQRAKSAQD